MKDLDEIMDHAARRLGVETLKALTSRTVAMHRALAILEDDAVSPSEACGRVADILTKALE